MFTVSPLLIRERFRTPGGNDFTVFCDAIIRAHCSFHGVPDAAFRGTLRTNVPDRGVDAEVNQTVDAEPSGRAARALPDESAGDAVVESVDQSIPNDTSGYMAVPTIWQYKAMERRDAYREMKVEVNKPGAVARIVKGYGYRLCIADEIPADEKTNREAELTGYVREIFSEAPEAKILSTYDLAGWVEQYLAVVMRYFRSEVTFRGQHVAAWGKNICEVTPKYQAVPDWESAQRQLEQHVNFARTPPEVVLSLQGESGVGKTRLVYETLAAQVGLRNLVVYTDSQDSALELARAVANEEGVRAIIVADECSATIRLSIKRTLQGCRNRVRVIAVDNTGDRVLSAAPEMWLGRMPMGVLEALLKTNYPHVPYERRRAYVQLSGGFAGLAADMCGNWDPMIAAVGNVRPALPSIREYLHSRIPREEDRFALMALSLVTKIGHADDLEGELDALCDWVGPDISKGTLKRAAHRLHDNPGYIARGVAFFYVRPELIAQIAFEDAWQRWAAYDPQAFLKRVPAILTDAFEKRVVRSAPEEVRGRVADFFRGFVTSLRPADLADLGAVDRLARLIDTNPEQYFPTLRRLIAEAGEDELLAMGGDADHSGRWGPRRGVVWLCERLASLPEFFDAAEEILLRLAVCETEPNISNSATGVWRRFFQIVLSGTPVPFPRRLSLLERRLAHEDERVTGLAIGGLKQALKDHIYGSLGPAVVAGRIPPPDWMPETNSEMALHFDAAVDTLANACGSGKQLLREAAFGLLLDVMFLLLQRGDLTKVRRMVADYEDANGGLADMTRVSVCEKVRMYLHIEVNKDEHGGKRSEDEANAEAAYADEVAQWLAEMVPRDFHGRLLAAVGIPLWERFEEYEKREWQRELRALAEALISDPAVFSSEAEWLFGPEAQSAPALGEEIGRLDAGPLDLLDDVVRNSLQRRTAGLARGYITGVLTAPGTADRVNAVIDIAEVQHPGTAFELFTAGGRRLRAFERTLRLVDVGSIAPEYLRSFAWARESETLTGDEFGAALSRLVSASEGGNARAGEAAIELLWTRAEDARRANGTRLGGDFEDGMSFPDQQESFPSGTADLAWRVMESVAGQASSMTEYKWGKIARALAPSDPVRAVRAATLALAGDRRDREAKQVLVDLAKEYPGAVMEELGILLLREDGVGVSLYMGNNKGLFGAIPDDVLIAWIDRVGLPAARRVARQLPPPYISEDRKPFVPPVTEHVLHTYGGDERVFDSFCMGVHSFQIYSGDIAGEHDKQADAAMLFLHHPVAIVRKWAEREINNQHEEAEWWRRRIEEQDF